MKTIKTTLLLLMTIMTFINTKALTPNPQPINIIWIGADIGLPGILNANTGIMLDKIGVQGRVGLIYPTYKTAEVSLMMYDIIKMKNRFGFDIKIGYLEYESDIYRYVGAGIRTSPFYDDFYLSGGIQYYYENNDMIFPVIPYFGIGYHIDYAW